MNEYKKELRLTEFGTFCSSDGFEMIARDFFKKLEKKYKSNDYNVSYNESDNNFNIKFDGVDYILKLDSETMTKYLEGKYNNITLRLKKLIVAESRLVDLEQEQLKIESWKKEEAKRQEKIIDNAERGIIPNDEARFIYLNELKKINRFSLKKFFDIFKESHDDNYNHRERILDLAVDFPFYILSTGVPCAVFIFGITFCIFAITEMIMYDKNYEFNLNLLWQLPIGGFILPLTVYFYPLATYCFYLVKNAIKYLKNKKLIKYKIKELTKKLNNSPEKNNCYQNFDNTLKASIREEAYEYRDDIYKEISNLTRRIEYINPSDRKTLLIELRSILNEYDERSKIINSNKEIISMDSMVKLRNEIFKKLTLVEQKMITARVKDISEEEKNKERLLLESEMDKYYIDVTEIERMQRERKDNLLPVSSVKKAKKIRKTLQ